MDIKRPKTNVRVPRIDILGVGVDDIGSDGTVEAITKLTQDQKRSHLVVTVNSEFIMLARKNRRFMEILNRADLALADGMGVVISKLIFGGKVNQRITGVDLIEKLCCKCAKKAIKVGFLGGFYNVAEIVASRQKAKYPGLNVVLAESGDPAIGFDLKLKNKISAVGRIDILFVAYGMGQQEFWINRFLNRVNIGVFIGVGGAFDYLSSVKIRAPRLLQSLGFEWLWRLILEPCRIGRMSVLPIFLSLVFQKWLINISLKVFKKNKTHR